MSLLRLLTSGKSLVGLRNSDGRYQVTRQRWLPKFGSKKNPFRTRSGLVQAPVVGEAHAALPAKPLASTFGPAPTAVAIACEPDSPGKPGKNNSVPKRARSTFAESARVYVSRLAAGLIRSQPKAARPVIPRVGHSLVQGELSLDRVKVVRNDLSDSDLEIVRSKAEPSATERPRSAEQPEQPVLSERTWNRVAGRLFGVGKT